MSETVGRFAPSPSGPVHLGNIACCLLAYLSARHQGGRFLLRIEDLDHLRCPPAYGEQVIRDLEALGFDWDEEPLWQSRRRKVYEDALRQLSSHLYPCFCTRAELMASQAPNLGDTQTVYAGTCRHLTQEEIREKSLHRSPAIRLRVPDLEIVFTDGLQGEVRENLEQACGDFIVRRSDGLFGYQLAVVVDDAASGVTEVVRGRDILSATPRQIYLCRLLGLPVPRYIHIPLLLNPHGRRLAKRDRDLGLDRLLQRFTPEQILGFLACAYHLIKKPEAISLPELVDCFDLNNIPREDVSLPAGLFEGL